MADKFPGTYVDKDSGEIKRFQTLREKVANDYLPEAGHIALLGVKVALLAPFVGGPLVAVPAALGVWAFGRYAMTKVVDYMHEKQLLEHKRGDFTEFDFTQEGDRKLFAQRYGKTHANFPDEYLHMVKAAKLEETPKVFVIEQFFKRGGRQTLGGLVSDWMAGTTSRPTGKDPVIMLGKGALSDLNAGELRAVIAHEMTHLKLEHPKNSVKWQGRMPLNSAVNVALVAAAIIGPLPLLPVLGVVVASNLIGRALKSIKSRHQEEMCDRGAALLTGGTGDLKTALGKIRGAMMKMQSIEVEYIYRKQGLDPPEPAKPGFFTRFVNGTHPSNERREKLLNGFEKKHSVYTADKRSFFTRAFNKIAPRAAPPPKAAAIIPPKPGGPALAF